MAAGRGEEGGAALPTELPHVRHGHRGVALRAPGERSWLKLKF